MRAVNLVPADSRPGRVNGGKSGGAFYAVPAVLVFLLLALSLLALSHRDKTKAQAELATIEQSTQSYTSVASQYASFESAASQAASRINTVRSLSEARFDWAGVLREMSRLIPADTQVLALTASIATDTTVGSGGATSTFRGALELPAVTMNGCTKSQPTAANLVTQLQAMRRVVNVTLASSVRSETESVSGGCTLSGKAYDFTIVVFFAAGKAQASDVISPSSAAPAASTIATESASPTPTPAAATPAASTPPATTPSGSPTTTSKPATGAAQ